MRCITPLKLKILKILNFSTIILIEISRPLATKLRDLKMFNMAFQVVFSAKNVPRFSFGLLVAPKLKKRGAIMPPTPPGQIGFKVCYLYSKYLYLYTVIPRKLVVPNSRNSLTRNFSCCSFPLNSWSKTPKLADFSIDLQHDLSL